MLTSPEIDSSSAGGRKLIEELNFSGNKEKQNIDRMTLKRKNNERAPFNWWGKKRDYIHQRVAKKNPTSPPLSVA